MMIRPTPKLKAKIQCGLCQNHHDNTCTKTTVLAQASIKPTKLTKVSSQKLPAINSEVIKENSYPKLNLLDQEPMIKILSNQECQSK